MDLSKLRVELRPVASLRPSDRNPRTHDRDQLKKIAASVRQFGWTNPILIDEFSEILAGEARWRVAKQLRMVDVPCIELSGLSLQQREAYRIADNRIPLDAGWNENLLASVIRDLDAFNFDLPVLGFAPVELDKIIAAIVPAAPVEEAQVEEEAPLPLANEHDVKPGDVWQLGRHRLMCGDSTNATQVAMLLDGEAPSLLFTSPPYGNQREYTTGGIGDWDLLMQGVFAAVEMAPAGQILVNLGLIHRDGEWQPYWASWLDWMRQIGWRRFGLYVWDQGPGLPGDWVGRLAPSFELVFHFCKEPRKPNKIVPCSTAGQPARSGGLRLPDGTLSGYSHAGRNTQSHRIPDSVIRVSRRTLRGVEAGHPAVFPVALPQFVMEAYSGRAGVVYEPFSGSGSSIIAGERCGRRVRAMELAPEYVDITLRRWRKQYPDVAPLRIVEGSRSELRDNAA